MSEKIFWFLESISIWKIVACLTWEPFEMNHQYAKTWGKLFLPRKGRQDKCVSEWKKRGQFRTIYREKGFKCTSGNQMVSSQYSDGKFM